MPTHTAAERAKQLAQGTPRLTGPQLNSQTNSFLAPPVGSTGNRTAGSALVQPGSTSSVRPEIPGDRNIPGEFADRVLSPTFDRQDVSPERFAGVPGQFTPTTEQRATVTAKNVPLTSESVPPPQGIPQQLFDPELDARLREQVFAGGAGDRFAVPNAQDRVGAPQFQAGSQGITAPGATSAPSQAFQPGQFNQQFQGIQGPQAGQIGAFDPTTQRFQSPGANTTLPQFGQQLGGVQGPGQVTTGPQFGQGIGGVQAPQAGQAQQFQSGLAALGGPAAQQQGQFDPGASALQQQLTQSLQQNLAQPGAFGAPEAQRTFSQLQDELEQSFTQRRADIDTDAARRGVFFSTAPLQGKSRLASDQARQLRGFATDIATQQAQGLGADRARAAQAAQAAVGQQFGQQLQTFGARQGAGQQAFQQDLASRAFAGDQNALAALQGLKEAEFGRAGQAQQFGQELAGSELGFKQQQAQSSEELARQQLQLGAQGQQFGEQLAGAQFGAGQQAARSQEELARAGLTGGLQQQQFGQQLAGQQFGAGEDQRSLANQLAAAQFGQGAQGQQFQQQLAGAQFGAGEAGRQFGEGLQGFGANLQAGQQGFANELALSQLQDQLTGAGFQRGLQSEQFGQQLAQDQFRGDLASGQFQAGEAGRQFQQQLAGFGANQAAGAQEQNIASQQLRDLQQQRAQATESQLATNQQLIQQQQFQDQLALQSGALGLQGGPDQNQILANQAAIAAARRRGG